MSTCGFPASPLQEVRSAATKTPPMTITRVRRSAALALTGIVAAAALVACGDTAPTAPTPPAGTGAGALTGAGGPALNGPLTVQASGSDSEIAALQKLLDAFVDANPAVDVQLTPVAEQEDHIAKLSTAFAGGKPPDVFVINYRQFGTFADKGVLEPLGDNLGSGADALDLDSFYPTVLEAFTRNDTLVCMPQNASSQVVYYNTALFEAAGIATPTPAWTLADFAAAAKALTRNGKKGLGFSPSIYRLAPYIWGAGGEIVDSTDAPTKITLDGEPARRVLDFFLGLQRDGVALDATDRAAEDGDERFARGELGMWLDSRARTPKFRGTDGLAFDVAPLPVGSTGKPVSVLHSDGYCVPRAGGNKAAALALARFAAGPAGSPVLSATGRTVPAFRPTATSPAFLDGKAPASAQVFLDQIPTLRRVPNVGTWSEAEAAADDALEQLFAGKTSLDAAAATTATTSAAKLRG